jgi:hypothetical protein
LLLKAFMLLDYAEKRKTRVCHSYLADQNLDGELGKKPM